MMTCSYTQGTVVSGERSDACARRCLGGLTRRRPTVNGGLKVRVMAVVPFLVGEWKRGSVHGSLPCVAAHGDRGEAERHKTGHLGVGGRAARCSARVHAP
jgi:hypothetical protein